MIRALLAWLFPAPDHGYLSYWALLDLDRADRWRRLRLQERER